MRSFRFVVALALLAVPAGCGDDETDPEPKPDASDAEDCPASGVPAVVGCPCDRPAVEYCCGVGQGVLCENKVWLRFFDSPCAPPPSDDGGADNEFIPPDLIECR